MLQEEIRHAHRRSVSCCGLKGSAGAHTCVFAGLVQLQPRLDDVHGLQEARLCDASQRPCETRDQRLSGLLSASAAAPPCVMARTRLLAQADAVWGHVSSQRLQMRWNWAS